MDSLQSTSSNCSPSLDLEDNHPSHLAPEDQVILTNIEEPARVRAWCMAKAEEYAARTRALYTVYNSAVPVNRLPPEVLMMVFSCLKVRLRTHGRYLRVCRMWTSLILRTHPFWVNLLNKRMKFPEETDPHFEDFRVKYSTLLSRTGALSLSLDVDGYPMDCTPLYTSCRHRIVRWTMQLRSCTQLNCFSELLSAGMPILEELDVDHGTHWDTWPGHHTLSPLFSHTFEPRCFASLRTLAIPWDVFTPSNTLVALEELTLHKCIGLPGVSAFQSVLNALSRCPHLIRISFNDHPLVRGGSTLWTSTAANALQNLPDTPSVELRRLAEIHVDASVHQLCSALLSHLTYPSDARVFIMAIQDHPHSHPHLITGWLPARLDNFRALTEASTLVFNRIAQNFYFDTYAEGSEHPLMSLCLYEPLVFFGEDALQIKMSMPGFANLLGSASSITSLSVYNSDLRRVDWETVLNALPQLLELKSYGKFDEEDLLPLLRLRADDPDPQAPRSSLLGPSGGCSSAQFGPRLRSLSFLWQDSEPHPAAGETSCPDVQAGDIHLRCAQTLADTLAAILSLRARPDAPFRQLSVHIPVPFLQLYPDAVGSRRLQRCIQGRCKGLVETVEVIQSEPPWLPPSTAFVRKVYGL